MLGACALLLVPPEKGRLTLNLDEIRQSLRPPFPALDIHVHPIGNFGPHPLEGPEEDTRYLLEAADRSGVEKMCLFSLHNTCPREPTVEQLIEANDYALRMRDLARDVFIPFCYVNPMYPDESVTEIDRCVDGERMCGIKLWVARRATDPGLDPILEQSVALDVPVLQHAWIKTTGNLVGESFPADVADLAKRHPKARIIMAHMNGCGLRGIQDVADCPNIYIDTSGGDPESGIVEYAVAMIGPGRVVFGSDAPIRHFGVQLGKVIGTPLPEDAKRDILWNNAAKLLPEWAGVKPLPGPTVR